MTNEEVAHLERLLAEVDEDLERHGWAILSRVEHERRKPAFAATLGLVQTFGHPELVVVGSEVVGEIALAALGHQVADGSRFTAWSKPEVEGIRFGMGRVHERHLCDLFAFWFGYWEMRGHEDAECRALQVVLPDRYFCACHAELRYRLDDPRDLVPRRARTRPHPGKR